MMNERIEKLISEAIEAIPDHVEFNLPKEFTEKFAELIVRECADIATINQHEWHSAGSYVLKHFGYEK